MNTYHFLFVLIIVVIATLIIYNPFAKKKEHIYKGYIKYAYLYDERLLVIYLSRTEIEYISSIESLEEAKRIIKNRLKDV